MKYVIAFIRFWYDFIVGDDWTIAAAVVIALVLTALVVQLHIAAWWLLPTVIIAVLWWSVAHATQHP